MSVYVHQDLKPNNQVRAHLNKSKLLKVSFVTTTVLKLIQYNNKQLSEETTSDKLVKVDNVIITPVNDQVGLMLKDVWLRIVNSRLPVTCMAD